MESLPHYGPFLNLTPKNPQIIFSYLQTPPGKFSFFLSNVEFVICNQKENTNMDSSDGIYELEGSLQINPSAVGFQIVGVYGSIALYRRSTRSGRDKLIGSDEMNLKKICEVLRTYTVD